MDIPTPQQQHSRRSIVHVNYAHRGYFESQRKNSKTAVDLGHCDASIKMGFQDLPAEYRARNAELLSIGQGVGLWAWKPEVVLRAFEQTLPGDIIVYSDAGQAFVGDIRPYVAQMDALGHDLFFFEAKCDKNHRRRLITDTKRHVLDHYGIAPDSAVADQIMASGNLFMARNTPLAAAFMRRWSADMCGDRMLIDNRLNTPQPEYARFNKHKHDMGVMNALIALARRDEGRAYEIVPFGKKRALLARITGALRGR